ncbi:Hypothetical predicted protein [Olea europaea subsp. europaea]|uniref:Uncharacterized protein n=1 Tax=Olea europaea subsp. europaea TaxID=158383 RepID=A0A8S0UPE5_OLEEU|nr:Hypothetical predicted protein [Olea europaea subsp. europaea]
MDYDRVGIKRCYGVKGFRINSRRFSVGRIRRKFLCLFRLLGRWRCSYSNALLSLKRNIISRRRRRRNNKETIHMELPYSYGSYSSDHHQYRFRTLAHSNSFCSEAIADCLDFIKRNSISMDEYKPMLNRI